MRRKEDIYIEKMVRKFGKQYKPALLPEYMQYGPMGKCFEWSVIQGWLNNPYNFNYCEGYGYIKGKPVYHAWLTDGEFAYDPTWHSKRDDTGEIVKNPDIIKYVGIEFAALDAKEFMITTHYNGILCHKDKAIEQFRQIFKRIHGVNPL